MKHNKYEIPVYSFLLAFCGVFFYGTYNIRPGRAKTVSDAFVPRVTLAIMAVLLIILLVKAIISQYRYKREVPAEEKEEEKKKTKEFLKKMGILIAVFTFTIIMMKTLGFIISMTFYLLFMFIWLAEDKKRNWKVIIPIGVLFPFTLFMVYLKVFSVLLPAGVLKFLS